MSDKTKIFISYGRKDGREFAGMLRDLLTSDEHAHKYELWQDVVSMEGGDTPWWDQILPQLENLMLSIKAYQHILKT